MGCGSLHHSLFYTFIFVSPMLHKDIFNVSLCASSLSIPINFKSKKGQQPYHTPIHAPPDTTTNACQTTHPSPSGHTHTPSVTLHTQSLHPPPDTHTLSITPQTHPTPPDTLSHNTHPSPSGHAHNVTPHTHPSTPDTHSVTPHTHPSTPLWAQCHSTHPSIPLSHLLSATVRVYSLVAPCRLPDLTSLALLGSVSGQRGLSRGPLPGYKMVSKWRLQLQDSTPVSLLSQSFRTTLHTSASLGCYLLFTLMPDCPLAPLGQV